MAKPLRIALCGLGTVGQGVVGILTRHADLLAARCGRPLQLVVVSARDATKARAVDISAYEFVSDPLAVATRADIDVVVEAMGGEGDPAKALIETAIAAGKSVVTANKALLAHHGAALAMAAEAQGVSLNFEAAVAGGIPIVKTLREGLAANAISRVCGILNGTCNYILTEMERTGADFGAVLAEAQALGYAEADPSFDVDGIDTAHKLAILSSLSFGTKVDFPTVHIEGIRAIQAVDIAYARELGFRIKLLGQAMRTPDGIEQRVHPCFVPLGTPMADVTGAFNAVLADGDFVGRVFLEGRGAGGGPTASAIIADLVDIARGLKVPTFAVPADKLIQAQALPMAGHVGSCYVRLSVLDQPGVMAAVTAILARHDVSIETMIQRGRAPGEAVALVMVVHETRDENLALALSEIAGLSAVMEPPRRIRIEVF
jgi:homoserine dehydrogenase